MLKWIILAATIVFWGLAFTAIKYAVMYISPISIATLRFAIADVLFLATVLKSKVERGDLPSVFLLGLFGVPVYHICLNIGENYISSGVASLIVALAPAFVLILSWAFLRERITVGKVAGTVLAFSGVVLISEPSSGNVLGILLVLISTIAAAIYTTLGKSLMRKYDAITLTSNAMVLGSLPLLIFLPHSVSQMAANMNFDLAISIVFLGVFSTYLGYLGWYYFLKTEEASKASIFLLAIPLVSLAAGNLLLGEALTVVTIAGALAVILGILLVIRS